MRRVPTLIALLAAAAAALAGPAAAQSGGDYAIPWSHLGAGGSLGGGVYALSGAAGQPDAGTSAGGDLVLHGGYFSPLPGDPVGAAGDPLPRAFTFRPAMPNPSRTTTTFAFELPTARAVELSIYSVEGRLVRRLASATRQAGRHAVIWDGAGADGRRVAPGIYLARLVAGDDRATHRFVRLD